MHIIRLVASLLVCAAAALPAAADGIVLESYTGTRPEEATKVLSPVLDELATKGFVAGYDVVGRKFESQVSRPASSPEGLPAKFAEAVDTGYKEWALGRFDEAVKILTPLVGNSHANPAAFAQNPQLRERLQKALIALALSQQRLGDPSAAKQTFAEVLRSFPDMMLERGTYGPDAYNQFEQARKENAGARGRLTVKVSSETAKVFINEKLENEGATTTKGDAVPGEYRVFSRSGKLLSRNHRAVVKPNEETTVTIDANFDAAVHSSPKWTGLLFATASDREKLEAAYAATFANAIDAHAVALVGIDQVRGRPVIVGALINLVNGHDLRRASLALEPEPPPERLHALAKFLAGDDTATTGLDVITNGEGTTQEPKPDDKVIPRITEHPERPEPANSPRWSGWKWLAGGGAVVGLGTGTALLVLNGRCSSSPPPNLQCPSQYNTAVPGFLALGGGAVLAGITVYLWLTREQAERQSSKTAYLVPTVGGAIAGYATSF